MTPWGWATIHSDLRDAINLPGDRDAKLRRVCEVLHERVPRFDWVGFYIADSGKRELVLGPYVGVT